ncbi:cation efflux system protein [Bacteroidia bacterium]|nr:cation efflux system protein [Bacteroidia bacterium]
MKKIYLAGMVCAYLLAACNSNTKDHDEHEHEHESHEHEHEHEGVDEIVLSPEKAASIGIKTKIVQPEDFTEAVKVSGRVFSAQGDEQTLVATTSGVVAFTTTAFTEGTPIRKGQPVLTLVTSKLPDGDVAIRMRILYEKAQSEYQRAGDLLKAHIISEKEYNQVKADYETAKAAFDAIGATASTNGGIVVTSPLNGFLKNLNVKEGDYVATGQPLATVSQNSRLTLSAELPAKYYNQLPLIRTANFKTAYDNRLYKLDELNGRLVSYARSAGTDAFIPVTFEFDNRGSAILPGGYIEAWLLTSPIPNTLSVPVSSLIEEQGIYSVFIQIDEEGYVKQEVKLGANNGAEVQIVGGLKPGDHVVTQAAYQLKLASATSALPTHHH